MTLVWFLLGATNALWTYFSFVSSIIFSEKDKKLKIETLFLSDLASEMLIINGTDFNEKPQLNQSIKREREQYD